MLQWAVDLSGEGYRSGNHACTLIGRSTSSAEECVFCFMSSKGSNRWLLPLRCGSEP